MAYVEMSYNPYLPLSRLKFNGHVPGTNSRLEKHEHQVLKEWVTKLPDLLKAEMNGYDFDLLFTGTVPDFEDLQEAFSNAGLNHGEVRLIHASEIEAPDTKSEKIDRLIDWLRENPMEDFSLQIFLGQNQELFEGSYPIVVTGIEYLPNDEPDVEMMYVTDVAEIADLSMDQVPFIMWTDQQGIPAFRKNLTTLLKRTDIRDNQMFFHFDTDVEVPYLKRIVQDLGVKHPQIVLSSADHKIQTYIRSFMVTAYVRQALHLFLKEKERLQNRIDQLQEDHNSMNQKLTGQMSRQEEGIHRLQSGLLQLDTGYESVDSAGFQAALNDLGVQIVRWNAKKDKIIGQEEGEKAADSFDQYLFGLYSTFTRTIQEVFLLELEKIERRVQNILDEAAYTSGLCVSMSRPQLVIKNTYRVVSPNMMQLYVERDFPARKDFNMVFNMPGNKNVPMVTRKVYILEAWRREAGKIMKAMAEAQIETALEQMMEYQYALNQQASALLQTDQKQVIHNHQALDTQLHQKEYVLNEKRRWLNELEKQLAGIEQN